MKILLAGTARCGSTWVANVLGRAEDTRTVYEPDGPMSDVFGSVVTRRLGEHPVLEPGEHNPWYALAWDLAFAGGWPWSRFGRLETARASARKRIDWLSPAARDYVLAALAKVTRALSSSPRNVLVKSVNCEFSIEWIARRYAPQVVILRRNPLNIMSSRFVFGHGAHRCIGDDPAVRDRFVRPLGLKPPGEDASAVTVAAWNVGLSISALKAAAERNPDWIVESHDELCIDPQTRFRALARALGLRWTIDMEDYLTASDTPGFVVYASSGRFHPNAVTATGVESRRQQQSMQYRRRLSSAQVAEARAVLAEFPLGDWGPPPATSDFADTEATTG